MILHQRTHYEGYYRNTKWIQIFWVWQLNKPDQNHREHKPPAAFHSSTASVCSSLTWTFAAFTEKEACQVIRPKEERAVLGNPPPQGPKLASSYLCLAQRSPHINLCLHGSSVTNSAVQFQTISLSKLGHALQRQRKTLHHFFFIFILHKRTKKQRNEKKNWESKRVKKKHHREF